MPSDTEKNYITPAGFRRLKAELNDLKRNHRPKITETVAWAASNGDRSENGDYLYGKKKLREIDRRIRFLNKRIDAAEVVDPTQLSGQEVRFGATVTFRDEDDNEKTFSIVGEDESDVSQRRISWKSPLAQALMRVKAKPGDWVTFRSPKGEQEIEVVEVIFREVE